MPVNNLNATIKVLIKDVPEAAIGCAAVLTMPVLKVVRVGMTDWIAIILDASLALMAVLAVVAFVAGLVRTIVFRNRRQRGAASSR
jgi:hypothetical protein